MPWTESRSREEWLAEVQRRGTRIRRRRRIGMGVVGAFALVLPVSVTAAVLRSGPEQAVEVSVAGPAPAGDVPTTTSTMPILAGAGAGGGGLAAATSPEATPPVVAPATTTTTEVLPRLLATNSTVVTTTPPRSVPPGTDPAGSPPITIAPVEDKPPAGTETDAPPVPKESPYPTLRPCAKSEVKLTVTTDKAVYARGETVHGSWTLEKATEANCRLEGLNDGSDVYTRTDIHFEAANGREVGPSMGASNGFAFEVAPEPQRSYSSFFDFSWDQKDCSIAILGVEPSSLTECTLALPGTYALVFEWNGAGAGEPGSVGSPHFAGRATFRITA